MTFQRHFWRPQSSSASRFTGMRVLLRALEWSSRADVAYTTSAVRN
jgi:hypothetical protein